MNPASVGIGISGGLALSFAVVVFAIVGLGPWFTWMPEVVLLIAAAASAVIYLSMAAARAVANLIVLPILGAGAGAVIGTAAAWVRR